MPVVMEKVLPMSPVHLLPMSPVYTKGEQGGFKSDCGRYHPSDFLNEL
jgi:hypothetical protein